MEARLAKSDISTYVDTKQGSSMISVRHWILTAICLTALLVTGCTTLGSRASLIDTEAAQQVDCYRLDRLYVTYRVEDDSDWEIGDADSLRAILFVGELAQRELRRLAEAGEIPDMFVLNDSIAPEFLNPDDASAIYPDPSSEVADDSCAGEAVMTIEIWEPGVHGHNAASFLHFFAPGDTAEFLLVTHNTMWGNSYWSGEPGYDETVPDAIEGSLKKAVKAMREKT